MEPVTTEVAGTGEKKLTTKEWKNLMRLYFTVRRPIVEGCGHKIDTERPPKGNCEVCWFAWFNNHAEIVQSTMQADSRVVTQLFGTKFVKMYTRFMALVAKMVAEGKIKVEEKDGSTNHHQD